MHHRPVTGPRRRFFFHLTDHEGTLVDHEGLRFANVTEMRTSALRQARELICEDIRLGAIDLSKQIDVTDSKGRLIHSLKLSNAVEFKDAR